MPQDDSYAAKEDLVIAWSFLVVKAAQFKILLVMKVGTKEQYTWATLTRWQVASVQALGEQVDVILENFSLENAHMFMHEHAEPFDLVYVKESCTEPDIVKPETIFIDAIISNTKVATMFTKLK